jgi:DNA-binding NarL/FixJ family response regulator
MPSTSRRAERKAGAECARSAIAVRSEPLGHEIPWELDVLTEMAEGKTNAAIADALVLSESAIEKHINSIFAKFGLSEEPQLHRRVAAVLAFLREVNHTHPG